MSGLRDVTGTPPVRGAGRTVDIVWPAPTLLTVGTISIGISYLDRQGVCINDRGTLSTFGVQPAGSGWTLYRGRIANKITGSGTSGSFHLGGDTFYFPQNRLATLFNDDLACWRIACMSATDTSAGVGTGDPGGVEVGSANNFNLRASAANPGYRLGPTSNTQISCQVRQNGGGAFTIDQVVATVADVADYHLYEMRFIGATNARDGIFRCFVDGQQVFSASYGAGTLLPSWGNGATLGYTWGAGNRASTAVYIPICGLQVSAASSEAALL